MKRSEGSLRLDLQHMPIEALEVELKRRREAQLLELKGRIREHELAIRSLEKDLAVLGHSLQAPRRRKARA